MQPDARREAILDAAQALFLTRGWDAVTVADVLRAADISKGGFYHHFAAKEDLLTGLVARITGKSLAAGEAARAEAGGTALARFGAFVGGAARWKADNIAELRVIVDILSTPGNEALIERILDTTAAAVTPVLGAILREGAEDGSFDPVDPAICGEVILGLSRERRRVLIAALAQAEAGDLDGAVARMEARMTAEAAVFDRLLGLPPGSVPLASASDHRRMLAGLVAARPGAAAPPPDPDPAAPLAPDPAPSPENPAPIHAPNDPPQAADAHPTPPPAPRRDKEDRND